MELATGCEAYGSGWLGQPASAVTSAAFVVAATGILVSGRRRPLVQRRQTVVFALLVAGIGVGSFLQHGPHPSWQAYVHDLPLAGVLAFVAVDAASDLRGRELSPAWWLVPTAAMVPVVAVGPTAASLAQAAMAVPAVGLSLLRAKARPALRRTLLTSLSILATGAAAGTLGDRTSLCQPDSLLQGHAVWHVLAAAALWRLAPAIGSRQAHVGSDRIAAETSSTSPVSRSETAQRISIDRVRPILRRIGRRTGGPLLMNRGA